MIRNGPCLAILEHFWGICLCTTFLPVLYCLMLGQNLISLISLFFALDIAEPTGNAWEDLAVAESGLCRCLVCGSTYQSRTNAFRHYKEKHMHSGTIYPCLKCNKTFVLERKMNDHLLGVHGISVKDLKRKHHAL